MRIYLIFQFLFLCFLFTEESKILRKILLKIFQWKSEKFVLVMKILKFFLKNNYRIFKSIITKQLEL